MIAIKCDYRNMDRVEEIASIVVRSAEGRKTVQLEKLLADRRKQLIARLREEMTEEQSGSITDPLLAMLAGLRRQRLEAEMTSRLLIAYGREFVRPRPYRLVDLADVAGMSISGIRTAYGDDEIDQVVTAIGRKASPTERTGYDK
jgi:hypothetical protein